MSRIELEHAFRTRDRDLRRAVYGNWPSPVENEYDIRRRVLRVWALRRWKRATFVAEIEISLAQLEDVGSDRDAAVAHVLPDLLDLINVIHHRAERAYLRTATGKLRRRPA